MISTSIIASLCLRCALNDFMQAFGITLDELYPCDISFLRSMDLDVCIGYFSIGLRWACNDLVEAVGITLGEYACEMCF